MRRIWLLGAALAGLMGLPEAALAHDRSSARLHFAGGPRIVVLVPSRPFVARQRLGRPVVLGHRPALRRPVILRPGFGRVTPFHPGFRHFAVPHRGRFVLVPRHGLHGFHSRSDSHFTLRQRGHFGFAPRHGLHGFHSRSGGHFSPPHRGSFGFAPRGGMHGFR